VNLACRWTASLPADSRIQSALNLSPLKSPPRGMFWSAPHALDSDFTPEDPLALDYLGQQVGLWLFKGFTTRTSRAKNYAVVL
jgi:hypothetical protein